MIDFFIDRRTVLGHGLVYQPERKLEYPEKTPDNMLPKLSNHRERLKGPV